MNDKKTWFITGTGRGMGADFAKAALAAGHAVVATGRNPDAIREALGEADDLLVVRLDVTSPDDARAAVRAAVDRFGRIDMLVNNAASFYAGYFEELTPEQIERQLATNLIGPMNVTRAVLPLMRQARPGAAEHRRAGAAPAPVHRGRRCGPHRGAEGRRPRAPDRRLRRAVELAGPRGRDGGGELMRATFMYKAGDVRGTLFAT